MVKCEFKFENYEEIEENSSISDDLSVVSESQYKTAFGKLFLSV